jgi:L-gulonolactone oxidase
MPNLGDIAYQTAAGATSTSTHGTGVRLTGLAGQIAAMRVVLADGSAVDCSPTEEPELFHCARVGLGALGLVSTITLDVVPAFNLAVVEEPLRVDAILEDLDAHVDGNDHFEFFWVPHTGWALTKTNNRTTEPLAPRGRVTEWWNDLFLQNYAFGALCRVGRRRPQWIPRLAKALPAAGRVTYVDQSHRVFASPRLVRFYEMEYAIPRAACGEALNRIRRFVEDSGLLLSFPVEVRFTAPDDIPLSTASGRESCYLAIHVFEGMEHRPYFEGVERIMDDYDGRPHWGKLHYQTAATLAGRYDQWDRFIAVRDRVDPERRFTNPYLDRVLGA